MVGVIGCFSGWPLATTAASTAAARDLHLMRQQQKTMTAKISSTMPPTHAIAIIAPLLSPVLVEDDPATDNMDMIITWSQWNHCDHSVQWHHVTITNVLMFKVITLLFFWFFSFLDFIIVAHSAHDVTDESHAP